MELSALKRVHYRDSENEIQLLYPKLGKYLSYGDLTILPFFGQPEKQLACQNSGILFPQMCYTYVLQMYAVFRGMQNPILIPLLHLRCVRK